MPSLNTTAISDTQSLTTRCITSPDINQITPQKVSTFMGGHNTYKVMTYNETCLAVAISYLVIFEGLSFKLS